MERVEAASVVQIIVIAAVERRVGIRRRWRGCVIQIGKRIRETESVSRKSRAAAGRLHRAGVAAEKRRGRLAGRREKAGEQI